jgi:FkbM family methyltransferase
MKKIIFSAINKITNCLSKKSFCNPSKTYCNALLAWKIPGIAFLSRFIYRSIKPKGIILIECEENKLYVNAKDEGVVPSLLFCGFYEKTQTELWKKIIKPGMVVVDIGANFGYYTLIAAKLIKNRGKVYAFEPEPHNYRILVKNIKLNNYTSIIPTREAVSNKRGKIKLFTDENNLGKHSFLENNVLEKTGFIEVETLSLDNFFREMAQDNTVDVIKIDTEGAEGLIIHGARRILKSKDIKIIMEFCPYLIRDTGIDPLKLLHQLRNYGFNIKYIDEIKQCVNPIRIMKILDICENEKNGKGNVNLFLEKE